MAAGLGPRIVSHNICYMKSLSTLDPTRRFSNRVDHYRRYRPSYPTAVIELIRETAGLKPGAAVADIGSGTGIFTRLLLEAGFDVSAVEPNEPMRQVAEADLGGFPGFHSIAAPAEQTGLPDHHAGALTAAQSFHWFERDLAQGEFRRILKPDGWVFLIWNERKPGSSAFNRDYQALVASFGENLRDQIEDNKEAVHSFFASSTYRAATFDNPHRLNWEQLRGRFLSSSYTPTQDDPRYPSLLAQLEEIFRSHEQDGRVEFEQQTSVHLGRL